MTTRTDDTLSRLVDPAHDNVTTLLGVMITTKVAGADTSGAFTMMEYTAPPHFDGFAPHRHTHAMEVCYVIHGTLACTLDDTTITASAGTSILVLPDVLHIFWNPTPAPVTYLLCCCPGGTGHHVVDLDTLHAVDPEAPAADSAATLAAVHAVVPSPADNTSTRQYQG